MKAYSLDLRQKLVEVYREGNVSQRQLAKQFRVALSFVHKLIKQERETGIITPKVRTKQTPPKLKTEQLTRLSLLVKENADATLVELCSLLEQETGVSISRSTMGRMLQKLNLTRKKNTLSRRERN